MLVENILLRGSVVTKVAESSSNRLVLAQSQVELPIQQKRLPPHCFIPYLSTRVCQQHGYCTCSGTPLTAITPRETRIHRPCTIGAGWFVCVSQTAIRELRELRTWPAKAVTQTNISRRTTWPILCCIRVARQRLPGCKLVAITIEAPVRGSQSVG